MSTTKRELITHIPHMSTTKREIITHIPHMSITKRELTTYTTYVNQKGNLPPIYHLCQPKNGPYYFQFGSATVVCVGSEKVKMKRVICLRWS